jgi:hypothetical protein
MSIADVALFPFVRQAVQTDPAAFKELDLHYLAKWQSFFIEHPLFVDVMAKYPAWHPDDVDVIF